MSGVDLLPERLRSRIEITDDHWLWIGLINNKGYGHIYSRYPRQPEKRGDKRPAHLVVWESLNGLVEIGLELDHLCGNTLCVRPDHLEPVTHAENQRRIGERQLVCRRGGHPRTAENTYRNPRTGKSQCRPCARERDAHRVPRRRSAS